MQEQHKYIIYMITNTTNGKSYIGKTINGLKVRWSQHKSKAKHESNNHFSNAIIQYGESVWALQVLYISFEKDDEHLYGVEKQLVEDWGTLDSGYNSTLGGFGLPSGEDHPCFGVEFSDERKKAISDRLKGHHHNLGIRHTPEQNAAKGERTKRLWDTAEDKEERKEKLRYMCINNPICKGYKYTEEQSTTRSKQLIGNTHALGKKYTENQKTERAELIRSRPLSTKNKSGVSGVCRRSNKKYTCWRVTIGVGGKNIKLGTFKNKNDAIIARWTAELEYGYPIRIYDK